MSFNLPKGQPITFNPETCNDYCPVYSNKQSCNEVLQNGLFVDGFDNWSLAANTAASINPVQLTISSLTSASILQSINLTATIEYVIDYSYTRNSGSWANVDQIDLTPWGLGIIDLTELVTDEVVNGSITITPTSSAIDDIEFIFRGGASTEVTLHYLKVCPVEGEGSIDNCDLFCFKIAPGYQSTNYLLRDSQDFSLVVFNDTFGAETEDILNASPIGKAIYTPIDTTVTAVKFWNEVKIENLVIDWGTYDATKVKNNILAWWQYPSGVKELLVYEDSSYVGGAFEEPVAGAIDTNTNIFSQFDGVDDHVKYQFDNIEMGMVNMIATISVNLTSGLHKLEFDLNQTTGVKVELTDTSSNPEFEFYYNGSTFSEVIDIDTDGIRTLTITVDDFTEEVYGDKEDVLTNMSLLKQCSFNADIYDLNNNYQGTMDMVLTETPVVLGASVGDYIEFCYDLDTLLNGKYRVSFTDSCNIYKQNYSNCFEVTNDADGLINLTYDQNLIIGNEVINLTGCVWLRSSLQEPIIEDNREIYQFSTGYVSVPYVFNRTIEILQVHSIPEFMREALAVAFMGVFELNDVSYQKLKDEDITMLFTSKLESPVRVSVHQVGNFARNQFQDNRSQYKTGL